VEIQGRTILPERTKHMAVRTENHPPKRLPGHGLSNLGLALGIWAAGCYFTAHVLPLGSELATD
jgi:hypothetical protein